MKILSLSGTIYRDMRKIGCKVLAIVPIGTSQDFDDIEIDYYADPTKTSGIISEIIEKFKPDILFQEDRSLPDIHLGLELHSIPRVWYSIDTHLHYNWHKHYSAIFDVVFCAQQNFVNKLLDYQPNVQWLPLYCEKTNDFIDWDKRRYDISFVGKLNKSLNPQRCNFFESLQKLVPQLNITEGDYSSVYNNSKIVVNESVNDDLNLRFFEATGNGALLITDKLSHSMYDILIPNEDYLLYEHGNYVDCAQKIEWGLNNHQKAMKMAKRAHDKILQSHTIRHRTVFLCENFKKILNKGNFVSVKNIANLAFAYEYCSRLMYPESIVSFFGTKANKLAEQIIGTPYESSALIVKALLSFQKDDLTSTKRTISLCDSMYIEPIFKIYYYKLRVLAFLLENPDLSVIKILNEGLKEFPNDSDLLEIKKNVSNYM